MQADRLHVVPCDFGEACAFVKKHHRHHKPPVGHKFSLAAADTKNAQTKYFLSSQEPEKEKQEETDEAILTSP